MIFEDSTHRTELCKCQTAQSSFLMFFWPYISA